MDKDLLTGIKNYVDDLTLRFRTDIQNLMDKVDNLSRLSITIDDMINQEETEEVTDETDTIDADA